MSLTHTENIPDAITKQKTMFMRLYHGEYSLPKTFWLFGVVGSCIIGLPLMLFTVLMPIFFASDVGIVWVLVLSIVTYALMVLYCYIVIVGQWRAADAYRGEKIWVILVKMCSVLWGLQFIADMPEKFFMIVKTLIRMS